MNLQDLKTLTAALAVAAPGLLGLTAVLPSRWLDANGSRAAEFGTLVARLAAVSALLAGLLLTWSGTLHPEIPLAGPFHLGIYFDRLSATLLLLVAFLLAVIVQYSCHYLAGDPAHGRFTRWLCLTGAAALMIVIAGNLVQLGLAWTATSLGLHQLLMFYPDRPGARLAARKKFLISRLGDTCLLGAMILTYQEFHTWDFAALFARAGAVAAAGPAGVPLAVKVTGFLLVAGAMMKSAQFPFHSWLPDTMETPTPVSALMHAGIINAGGFLVIRLAPLLALSPLAMTTLAGFGAFTALFASLVMLTHASIKRCLAFSTVAQMGFMMLECGLGAFPLAVLHLVAHSLYKGHAFLASGGAAQVVRPGRTATVPRQPSRAVALLVAAGLMVAVAVTQPLQLAGTPTALVLNGSFTLALAWYLWNIWRLVRTPWTGGLSVGRGLVLALVYTGWHQLFDHLMPVLAPGPGAATATWQWLLAAAIVLCFAGLLAMQWAIPSAHPPRWQQALYVHARNGFYFNTLANQAVAAFWPLKPAGRKPAGYAPHE